jgi:FKBP-type peptidyl-prolyl cis-trans isomerase FklB
MRTSSWSVRGIGMAVFMLMAVMAVVGAPPAAGQATAELPAAQPQAAPLDSPSGTLGYALGLQIGRRVAADFKGREPAVDPAALARGLADAVLEVKPQLSEQQMRQALEAFETVMRDREREFGRRMAEAAKTNLAKAAEFAKANAAKPGIVTRPSGLQYEVIREGTGPSPKPGDTVVAHYRGTHVDGSEFDGTDPQGEPATFPLRGVVPGWQEALPLMKTGGRWRIFLPPQLAYGEEGSPPVIEPNELLIFEIELVRIAPSR